MRKISYKFEDDGYYRKNISKIEKKIESYLCGTMFEFYMLKLCIEKLVCKSLNGNISCTFYCNKSDESLYTNIARECFKELKVANSHESSTKIVCEVKGDFKPRKVTFCLGWDDDDHSMFSNHKYYLMIKVCYGGHCTRTEYYKLVKDGPYSEKLLPAGYLQDELGRSPKYEASYTQNLFTKTLIYSEKRVKVTFEGKNLLENLEITEQGVAKILHLFDDEFAAQAMAGEEVTKELLNKVYSEYYGGIYEETFKTCKIETIYD